MDLTKWEFFMEAVLMARMLNRILILDLLMGCWSEEQPWSLSLPRWLRLEINRNDLFMRTLLIERISLFRAIINVIKVAFRVIVEIKFIWLLLQSYWFLEAYWQYYINAKAKQRPNPRLIPLRDRVDPQQASKQKRHLLPHKMEGLPVE